MSVAPQSVSAIVRPVRLPGALYQLAKRSFDLVFAAILLLLLALPMIVIAAVIRLTSRGPSLYWSDRVGINNRIFWMPKFRTMRLDAPQVATHLLQDPDSYLTSVGSLLRRTSLDELPQLISILKGDLSFVGPRPALFNQDDLVALRTERGVHRLMPGLTGWAQVNGRDSILIPQKVELDYWYLTKCSFPLDLQILLLTLLKVMRSEDVSH